MVDVSSPVTGSPGATNVKIWWGYKDTSTQKLIDPTSHSAKLYDPNGVQRDFANTDNNGVGSITPVKDVDGSVSGTPGKYYATITLFGPNSLTGTWWVEVTQTHEGVTKQFRVLFKVLDAGADVETTSLSEYCTAEDVIRYLARNNVALDANTPFSKGDMEVHIRRAEDLIDTHLNTTFRAEREVVAPDGSGIFCDMIYNRLSFSLVDYLASFKVPHGPILSITKIEVFRGGQGYQDVTSKVSNEGRPNGIWFNPNGTEVFLGRDIALPSVGKNAIRIKYKTGLGFNQYVKIPGEVTMACYKLAAAEFLASERWARMLPSVEGEPSYAAMADKMRAEAYSHLEYRRGIVWS